MMSSNAWCSCIRLKSEVSLEGQQMASTWTENERECPPRKSDRRKMLNYPFRKVRRDEQGYSNSRRCDHKDRIAHVECYSRSQFDGQEGGVSPFLRSHPDQILPLSPSLVCLSTIAPARHKRYAINLRPVPLLKFCDSAPDKPHCGSTVNDVMFGIYHCSGNQSAAAGQRQRQRHCRFGLLQTKW